MNDDQVDDLKQFITTVITQQTSDLRQDIDRLDQKIDDVDQRLSQKIDDVDQRLSQKIDDVDAKLDTITETLHGKLENHETRITKLEQVQA